VDAQLRRFAGVLGAVNQPVTNPRDMIRISVTGSCVFHFPSGPYFSISLEPALPEPMGLAHNNNIIRVAT
jgi:hypothetical protein